MQKHKIKLIERPSFGFLETRIGNFEMFKPSQKELKDYYSARVAIESATTDEDKTEADKQMSDVVLAMLNTRSVSGEVTVDKVNELVEDELRDLIILILQGYRDVIDIKEYLEYASSVIQDLISVENPNAVGLSN